MMDATEGIIPEHAEPQGRRPVQVSAAFWVFLALVAVKLAFVPFTIMREWAVTDSTLAASWAKSGETVPAQTAGLMHGGAITTAAIVVALYGLCVLAAFRLRRGVAWARIVLTVLGAVCIVVAVFALSNLTGLAMGAAGIAGIVLLWLPRSNAWFRAAGEAQRAKAQRRATTGTPVNDASLDTPASIPTDSPGS